jgi:hypothetical protein
MTVPVGVGVPSEPTEPRVRARKSMRALDKRRPVRVRRWREALRTLALNQWVDVEQTVGELRIRLGERTRRLSEPANT